MTGPKGPRTAVERRTFFKLAGVSAAALAVGGALFGCEVDTPTLVKTEANKGEHLVGWAPIAFEETVDVLIVGSGIAGLSAALDPIEAKRTVLVVDKQDLLGGESYEANGLFHVSGTEIQKKAGIAKTAEDAWKARKKQLEEEGNTDNLDFKQSLIMAQAEWVDRVIDDYDAEFADPKTYSVGGQSDSILLPKNGVGDMESVMAPIKNALNGKGVTFKLGMQATAFILDEQDKVVGMRFNSPSTGKSFDVKAAKIVLATGGFVSSQKLMSENLPDQVKIGCATVFSTGDGIALSRTLGGQTADMNKPALLIGDLPQVCTWGTFGTTMNLSPAGERFAREDQVGRSATECVSQELGYWWTVFDEQVSKGSQSRNVAFNTSKYAKRLIGPYDTIEDLAAALKVPEGTLKETFENYDKAVEAKKDEDLGRTMHLESLKAPYYAMKLFPVRYKTLGGMQTDEHGRLTGIAGAVIENVFCCGSCAAGSANGLASNAAFGMIVGKAIVEELTPESEQRPADDTGSEPPADTSAPSETTHDEADQ